MFMFPEPQSKDHALTRVNINIISSEQHTPLGFPRCTQSNFGFFARPIADGRSEWEVKKVQDVILDKWTNDAKTWWIGKPGENAQMLFERAQQFKDNREIDPRFMIQNSIFPRSFKYELDCLESRRHKLLLDKIELDEANKKFELAQRREGKVDIYQQIRGDYKAPASDPSLWHQPPYIFGESQTDPCIRRAEFEKFRQPFKTEACGFYYKHHPPPSLPKHIRKFS